VESKNKQLRSGYTTGACAAAAAKAATLLLLRNVPSPQPSPTRGEGDFHLLPAVGEERGEGGSSVEIPFPDGSRVQFGVRSSEFGVESGIAFARASIIKDAGDDPDITNGAEIVAEVRSVDGHRPQRFGVRSENTAAVTIRGGRGVGIVTKPGLAIAVGEPAINPVPRKMILAAVQEAVSEYLLKVPNSELRTQNLEVTVSVPNGEELAKKTLNDRLGIVGGISILGTTGIVKPLSEAAWTATITASFDVAKAIGLTEVVVSTGRTSEKAHQNKHGFPAEAYAMMGDFTEFSLQDAKRHGFQRVHVCAQWAKMVKIAMETPHTHVRHGALEAEAARDFLIGLGIGLPKERSFNTTREIYDYIHSVFPEAQSAIEKVCNAANAYCEKVTAGISVIAHLVSYEGEIIAESS